MASAAPNSGPPTPVPSFRAHLKGIVSSNDDPDKCALCHGCIRYLGSSIKGVLPCCGKRICSGCPHEVARRSVTACSCCGTVNNPNQKSLISRLKKQAKAGTAWAQSYMGTLLYHTGSGADGLRWLEKAAEGGHPAACYYLGSTFMGGTEGHDGTSLNYGRAREYLERAMLLDDACTNPCRDFLVKLADMHYEEGENEAFISIILPLASNGHNPAQLLIAVRAFKDEKEPLVAYPLLKSAVLGADGPYRITESAYWAMACSANLGRFAIAKLLLPMASKCVSFSNRSVEERVRRVNLIVVLKQTLCDFRKECATCGTALGRSNRRLCRGCRNHCYCSRECQKLHWNRKKDGHSAECKEAQELKVQIRDAGLMEKLTKK